MCVKRTYYSIERDVLVLRGKVRHKLVRDSASDMCGTDLRGNCPTYNNGRPLALII
jgi:hypothetical protein